MPKRLLILGAIGVALLAAACKGNTTITNQPAETSGITVSGHGEVQVPPDIGFIDIGVQSTATSVADARDHAATAATSVLNAIKANGVEDKDIQTTGISIQPNYDYSRPNQEPRLTGYTVTNTVEAKVRKLDLLSKVIDDATAAGGNDVLLRGIRFGIDDEQKAKQDAREKAMADAKAKAQQLATLGAVSLGAPVTINETQGTFVPDGRAAINAPTTGSAATPIQPGTNTVSIDVTVRWSLK
jgi:uncharacterized protein YggE